MVRVSAGKVDIFSPPKHPEDFGAHLTSYRFGDGILPPRVRRPQLKLTTQLVQGLRAKGFTSSLSRMNLLRSKQKT